MLRVAGGMNRAARQRRASRRRRDAGSVAHEHVLITKGEMIGADAAHGAWLQ
jgi:hypothetical protein